MAILSGKQASIAIFRSLATLQFAFSVAAVAVVGAKLTHLFAHLDALPRADAIRWGASFFAQDTILLCALRGLMRCGFVPMLASLLGVAVVLFEAAISISFYMVAGTEIKWRNATSVALDSAAWKMLLTGLLSLAFVVACLLIISAALQGYINSFANVASELALWPVAFATKQLSTWRRRFTFGSDYRTVLQEDGTDSDEEKGDHRRDTGHAQQLSTVSICCRVGVGIAIAAQLICTIIRPDDSSMHYLSWTLPLVPFIDFATPSAPTFPQTGGFGNFTTLTEPVKFSWMPKGEPLAGFEDWYEPNQTHYSATIDPLRLSNLDEPVLPSLRKVDLSGVSIRHVLLITMESTRKDVFPLKKHGLPWEQLSNTHKGKDLPEELHDKFASLTSTARYLTGDYDDGFEGQEDPDRRIKKQRGGINVNNAYTTSTYTLKSLTGTHCGLSPLTIDFNAETSHHIYQPCLPHILEGLNRLNQGPSTGTTNNFRSLNWTSRFMQSTTLNYDKQKKLMPKLGFAAENTIGWHYLKGKHKFGPVNITDVNYYGMPEVAIEDYLRDAIVSAKEKNERLFLSHLTSTTHDAFGIPDTETNVPFSGDKDWELLSKYINAVGYVDRWLGKILRMLDTEGIANETLVVFVGDHGLSIAERRSRTPYDNPNVGNFHVPLVISHPKLPQINIEEAVSSLQILPTVLDLLVESGSLAKSQKHAASDLLHNYEGQSLLRPLKLASKETGQSNWQFTVMNPGGSSVAVRDASHPHWRIMVPLNSGHEWRFTDLSMDPHEKSPLVSFHLKGLVEKLKSDERLVGAAEWAEEAGKITGWWVKENHRRWRYG